MSSVETTNGGDEKKSKDSSSGELQNTKLLQVLKNIPSDWLQP
jgi:hypothetical protein